MTSLTLQCPQCGFQKSVSPEAVPDHPVMARCPRCEKAFRVEKGAAQFAFSALPESHRPHRPAGFWVRACALLVDGVILTLLQSLMGISLATATALLATDVSSGLLAALEAGSTLASLTVLILYMAGLTAVYGQTPGKRILGLKVIRPNGAEAGFLPSVIREVPGKMISLLLMGYGFLMAAFRKDKTALHDSIADTRVIHV